MSDYTKVTRHPLSHEYKEARWHDNYFGPHLYGVSFPGDKVVYPADQVDKAQLQTFWADDVLTALRDGMGFDATQVVYFLTALDATYKDRWKRDPEGGDGAVDWLQGLRNGDIEL